MLRIYNIDKRIDGEIILFKRKFLRLFLIRFIIMVLSQSLSIYLITYLFIKYSKLFYYKVIHLF